MLRKEYNIKVYSGFIRKTRKKGMLFLMKAAVIIRQITNFMRTSHKNR